MSRSFNCKLTIHDYNSAGTPANLELNSGKSIHKNKDQDGLTQGLTFTVGTVEFLRKIYEPNTIKATVFVSPNTNEELPGLETIEKMFLMKPVSLDISIQDSTASTSETTANTCGKIEATNYYIHNIKPVYDTSTTSTGVSVELTIKSIDNLLTLNKYSQAYLGRKFKSEIIASMLPKFLLKYKSGGGDKNLSTPLKSSYLQNLYYDEDSDVNNAGVVQSSKHQVEFIQPYLVQYNESFYDFIVRIANRCGEFLFFEDGGLKVGLPYKAEATSKNINKSSIDVVTLSSDDYISVEFGNISQSPLSVKDYSRDSLKNEVTAFSGSGTLNFEKVKPSANAGERIYKATGKTAPLYYPADTNLISTNEEFFYNSEIAGDEFFMPLYKDGFGGTAFSDTSRGTDEKHYSHIVATILAASSLLDLILELAAEYIQLKKLNDKYKGEMNARGDERFIKPDAPSFNPESTAANFNEDPDYVVPFSENNLNRWTTLKYYSDIRANQEELQKRILTIRRQFTFDSSGSDTFKEIKLGSVINPSKLTNDHFIVIEIQTIANSGEDLFSQNNNTNDKKKKSEGAFTEIIKAIPLKVISSSNSVPSAFRAFPPVIEGSVFRQSGPQPAFVVDAADPKRQGRVRVRYPWQSNAPFITSENVYRESGSKADNVIKAYDDMKTEAATPWIRMATPSASNSGGIYFEAEPGDEVMVDFENGNVERPYVVGALYSKNNLAPVGKGRRVIKSKFGHTLRFKDPSDGVGEISDSIGKQRVMGQILPFTDMISLWTGNDVFSGDNDIIDQMTGGIDFGDAYGIYNISMSSDERAIKISSPFGNVSLNAFSGISISAPNGNIKIAGKNIDITASNRVKILSGTNLEDGNRLVSAFFGGYTSIKDTLNSVVDKFLDNYQLIDLSLIRNVVELALRPVDGTLTLKSLGFVKIEAGDGIAEIPKDNYTPFYKWAFKTLKYDTEEKKIEDVFQILNGVADKISEITGNVYATAANYVSSIRNLFTHFEHYFLKSGILLNVTIDEVKDRIFSGSNELFKIGELDHHVNGPVYQLMNMERMEAARDEVLLPINGTYLSIMAKINELKDLLSINSIIAPIDATFEKKYGTNISNNLKQEFKNAYNAGLYLFGDVKKLLNIDSAKAMFDPVNFFSKDIWDKPMLYLRRKIMLSMLSFQSFLFPDFIIKYNGSVNVESDNDWNNAINDLSVVAKPDPDYGSITQTVKGLAFGAIDIFAPDLSVFMKDNFIWKDGAGVKGKVLISDHKDKTVSTDDNDSNFAAKDNESIRIEDMQSAAIIHLREKLRF